MTDKQMVALAARQDIFRFDNDTKLGRSVLIALAIAILLSIYFSNMQIVMVPPEYFENLPQTITAKIVISEKKDEKKEKKKEETAVKKLLKVPKMIQSNAPNRGVGKGDIKERVTQKGLLAIISGRTKSANVAGANAMNNVFAKDLDQVLENIGGLKTAGNTALGRTGMAGKQFNTGYAGGGGAGGIDDLLGALAEGGARQVGGLTKRASVDLPNDKSFWADQGGLSGRNPQDIYRVVMQHIGGLRSEYNKRLREKPNLRGKITVRFTIDPPGNVTSCIVTGSTMNDKILEMLVASRVKSWKFDACGQCGLATVTYPFAFSQ
ncbi:MAG: AgmX/PglI C-terminal domain-containing protein [Fibrobacterota bacterium]